MRKKVKKLKIKDNVDLKELEKFGFEKKIIEGETFDSEVGLTKEPEYFQETFYTYWEDDDILDISIEKKINNKLVKGIRRIIEFEHEGESYVSDGKALSIIYDLIKADLVETVEVIEEDN